MSGGPAVLVEACVDSVESAQAAEQGGAARVELCANLGEGGTTPSGGTIAACCERLRLPVFVIIRPRGGDFLYSDLEFEVMRRDIALAKQFGARGVVLGMLRRDGCIDVERTRVLVEHARPLSVTFHRAFDVCRDPIQGLGRLIELGVDRVLTSGQAATAVAGVDLIVRLVRHAAGRIGILPGGGINEENVRQIVLGTGAREVHVRGTSPRPSGMEYRNPRVTFTAPGVASDDVREVTDPARIRRVIQQLDACLSG